MTTRNYFAPPLQGKTYRAFDGDTWSGALKEARTIQTEICRCYFCSRPAVMKTEMADGHMRYVCRACATERGLA